MIMTSWFLKTASSSQEQQHSRLSDTHTQSTDQLQVITNMAAMHRFKRR